MCSERPYDGRPCHMRIVWCNCDVYVRWYETYLLFNFEGAFQAWFDAISDERVAQRYSFKPHLVPHCIDQQALRSATA